MCNDFGNRIPYSAYVEEFAHLRLPLVAPEAAPNLEPRDEIWPTTTAPLIRATEGGVALTQTHWGLAPSRPKAPVLINMRSENRNFTQNRCLVPASHYFEFTGTRSPKTRWRFTRTGEDWFCFAAVLGRGADGEAFSLLTAAAGPTRQPVILPRDTWAAWLAGAPNLLHPSPAGTLTVVESPRTPTRGSLL